MNTRFPDIPIYQGWGHPVRIEATVEGMELLQGELPAGLNGTCYKVGPDRQFPPKHGSDVFTDGEGMVFMFRFDHGRVDYLCRWVRNARFLAQKKAGRSLFGEYRNLFNKDPLAADVHGGTANTNAIYLGGKLLILKEDDMPYEVNPDTLETIGRYTYDGRVTAQRLSAHPKMDLVNDTVLNFSHQAKGDGTPDTVFYEFDRSNKIIDEIWFKAPFAGHVHDYAITEHHVIFLFHPLVTELETVKRTGRFYEWQPERGARLAVLKRHGTADDIRWFDGPAITYGHMINAFEEGSKINFDLLLADGNFYSFMFPPRSGAREPLLPQRLRRIEIDMAGNDKTYKITAGNGTAMELARIDDRYQGHPYRHVWMLVGHPPSGVQAGSSQGGMAGEASQHSGPGEFIDIFNGDADIGHIDLRTGVIDKYSFGPRTNVHEPQFIPRTPDSPEGDGWVLIIVNRLNENRSELAIFDALKISAGPVALYDIGVRVRSTFHGNWVPEETFRTNRYGMKRAANAR